MKKILGLDIGTNSIGWALIDSNSTEKKGAIQALGSRVIPMTADVLSKFNSGVTESQTAKRTGYRGTRRLYQRDQLRRERLLRVLNILNFLPAHFRDSIDFETRKGQFKLGTKTLLPTFIDTQTGQKKFLFQESFLEMAQEFKSAGWTKNLPFDLTLIYLRKKALSHPISKSELAWLLLNFNQKRGYYQMRDEITEEDSSKKEEYFALKVIDVKKDDQTPGTKEWYNVTLENGWVYRRQSDQSLTDWIGTTKEFVVTTTLDANGDPQLNKDGQVKRNFRAPKEADWGLVRTRTEHLISNFNSEHETVGVASYLYAALLNDPSTKLNGALIKTVERKFYKAELTQILETQAQFHPEFRDEKLYELCINELYPRNEVHRKTLLNRDLCHLISNDIIFYQRPLKSKKSTIADCQYEARKFKNDSGEYISVPLKGIPKSHPLFEEFRILQFIQNLRVYKDGFELEDSSTSILDVTAQLFSSVGDWERLLEHMSDIKEIDQDSFLKYLISQGSISKKETKLFRWNYVPDKTYPLAPTRALFLTKLSRIPGVNAQSFLTTEKEIALWHIIYSVSDLEMYRKAIETFARKSQLPIQEFVEQFKNFKPFDSSYGAYSYKALTRLLPLMRFGKKWNAEAIPPAAIERLDSLKGAIIEAKRNPHAREVEASSEIPKALITSFLELDFEKPYSGFNTYQACYAVYGRHSEVSTLDYWKSPEDITRFLRDFKNMSLRNPIVEQVVLETLRIVRDIWITFGNGKPDFFDEIHIELGREMKNPADKREAIAKRNQENENTNLRIKALLDEIANDPTTEGSVRSFSPSHQELLKVYESGIYESQERVDDEIENIRKNRRPSHSEILKYKLWLEQGYLSPYTGKVIPLSRLFTDDYQVEHIIPKSRYFDDSLSNKVICEANVNALKDNYIAYDFIEKYGRSRVDLSFGRSVELLSLEAYQAHCKRYFRKNRPKLTKLLSKEVPDDFVNRQLNDTRYISKFVMGLLSNILRVEGEVTHRSKNLVPVTGSITSQMKRDWGLNDIWNDLIAPRFQRLNEITGTTDFGYFDVQINAFRTQIPEYLSRGFSKKRIDHRHHALDALVIACTSTEHVNYLNSLNSARENHALIRKLRKVESIDVVNRATGEVKTLPVAKEFLKPWPTFTQDAKGKLETTVISFKNKNRVINKTTNKYWSFTDENGNPYFDKNGQPVQRLTRQIKGESWAIRQSLHQESVSGRVTIRRKAAKPVTLKTAIQRWEDIADQKARKVIKKMIEKLNGDRDKTVDYFKKHGLYLDEVRIDSLPMYENVTATAKRTALNSDFTRKQLEAITDSGIQKILENHLKNYTNEKGVEDFETAFGEVGLTELNQNIITLNNGKPHQPIRNVRLYEVSQKFPVGTSPDSKHKYVETAKGTNLFFAVYWNEKLGKRTFETVPLNEVIEHQKQTAHLPVSERTPIPVNPEKGQFLFALSPGDLVYVPTDEEWETKTLPSFSHMKPEVAKRVCIMEKASGNRCYFQFQTVSSLIANYDIKSPVAEFGSQNKFEKLDDGTGIKEHCIKLNVNALGLILGFSRLT